MAVTQVRPAPLAHQADGETPAVGNGARRHRRFGMWIWTVLHAQALLDGRTGPYDVTFFEDDWRQMSARQAARRAR